MKMIYTDIKRIYTDLKRIYTDFASYSSTFVKHDISQVDTIFQITFMTFEFNQKVILKNNLQLIEYPYFWECQISKKNNVNHFTD